MKGNEFTMLSNAASSAGFQPAVSQVSSLRHGSVHCRPADWKSAMQQAESLRYQLASDLLERFFA